MAISTNGIGAGQGSFIAPATSGKNELGSLDFMQLIIAQLRNQNPLEPQKDTDFMAQMAQFEALNQMKTVAAGLKVLQGVNELTTASSMLGKTVTGAQGDAIAITRDLVSREQFSGPFNRLPASQQIQVNNDQRVKDAVVDAANTGKEVTGRVDRVVIGPDGIPMLLVGTKVVDLFTVAEVR
ncbi:MAG: hypothetical protein HY875_07350 [Chloroflexi bacterium]|nr:hypothetical protein [Chloroflexota bacterium]